MTMGFRDANLLEHPAIRAWAKLQPERVTPTGIGTLREKLTGSVYRLEGVGPGGSDVIAKRSSPKGIRKQRTLYEQVLPALPIPTVRYYGFVEEPDDACCWLFLENAGGEEYSPLIAEHRALAARWLGLLHTAAAGAAAAARLPDRGPGHYLHCLRSAHRGIRAGLANPALSADDLAMLQTLL